LLHLVGKKPNEVNLPGIMHNYDPSNGGGGLFNQIGINDALNLERDNGEFDQEITEDDDIWGAALADNGDGDRDVNVDVDDDVGDINVDDTLFVSPPQAPPSRYSATREEVAQSNNWGDNIPLPTTLPSPTLPSPVQVTTTQAVNNNMLVDIDYQENNEAEVASPQGTTMHSLHASDLDKTKAQKDTTTTNKLKKPRKGPNTPMRGGAGAKKKKRKKKAGD